MKVKDLRGIVTGKVYIYITGTFFTLIDWTLNGEYSERDVIHIYSDWRIDYLMGECNHMENFVVVEIDNKG